MKKLNIRALALKERFCWDHEVTCDGQVIGKLVSKFEGREKAVWYHDKSKDPFTERRDAVLDLGHRAFGEGEEFTISPGD